MIKKFENIKIVGCLMVHDGRYSRRTIENLSKFTSEIYVNLNDADEKISEFVKNYPNVKKYIETKNDRYWSQAYERDLTIRLLDDVKPDLVLFPDDDELFLDNLTEVLKDFWQSDKKVIYFVMDYCWDSEFIARKDGVYGRMYHVRAFKWQPNLIYHPYVGKACPRNFYGREYAYYDKSKAKIKHLGYMTEEDRQIKFQRDRKNHYLSKPAKLIKI